MKTPIRVALGQVVAGVADEANCGYGAPCVLHSAEWASAGRRTCLASVRLQAFLSFVAKES